MKKDAETLFKVDSWYPSAKEIVQAQREHVLKAREEAAAFAAQKFGRPAFSWWRRLIGQRD